TFSVTANIKENSAPAFPAFPSAIGIKLLDPPRSIDLKDVWDPEGDRITFATASQFPNIAEASISNNFLIIKPVSVGTTQIAIGARDIYGAQSQTLFSVVVSPGMTI